MSPGLLDESLFAYFLQPPDLNFSLLSPIKPSLHLFESAGRFVYCTETIGCLWFGLPIGAFASFGKDTFLRDKRAFFTGTVTLSVALCVAFVNFCVGGASMRYTLDVLPMLSLVGASAVVGAQSYADGKKRAVITLTAFLLFTLAVLSGTGSTVFFSSASV